VAIEDARAAQDLARCSRSPDPVVSVFSGRPCARSVARARDVVAASCGASTHAAGCRRGLKLSPPCAARRPLVCLRAADQAVIRRCRPPVRRPRIGRSAAPYGGRPVPAAERHLAAAISSCDAEVGPLRGRDAREPEPQASTGTLDARACRRPTCLHGGSPSKCDGAADGVRARTRTPWPQPSTGEVRRLATLAPAPAPLTATPDRVLKEALSDRSPMVRLRP
jgi:hypothetical protein